ncbi:MAG: ribosome biogenesis GTPase YlqF [Clostridium sp.]|nr:ribosome biogenesis GTPase YlqF [Acetatifactor muris]MCM1527978.1 ribosome biogenesis GTPase YlqF [Bacteroides sp.]MCM1564228.1 ribosome biogenesis GTPase YlqF [Clostridium sp.]
MNYQWYPGHMTKAVRMMQENIKLIDLIIELVDARIPSSSRNPDINELGKNKFRIVLLNKSDLADPAQNKQWVRYFQEQGAHVLEINSKSGSGVKAVGGLVQEVCREKTERDRKRGIVNRPVRAMVVGIPNVGKSTFINSFAGKACTKTGNKPGVTKGKQWIRLNKNLELLDTPGILWPKFEDAEVGMHLAFIGSMNDEIMIPEELACDLIRAIDRYYPRALAERYGSGEQMASESALTEQASSEERSLTEQEAAEILRQIAVNRKCFAKGDNPDLTRAAGLLIDDFRSGRLGRMTLERR